MKIIITEVQLQELKGQYKDEVEILYKDRNMVCMIPKSQMTSDIYGKKANWCQRQVGGFGGWSRQGLLIRFLFRDKRKIRFTYFFKKDTHFGVNFYWANEGGQHVLEGNGNPFLVQSTRHRESSIEKDILIKIKDIPEECREIVLKFIEENKEQYKYCYRENTYVSLPIRKLYDEFININKEYRDKLYGLSDKNRDLIAALNFDPDTKEFLFKHSEVYGAENNFLLDIEKFKDPNKLRERLDDYIIQNS